MGSMQDELKKVIDNWDKPDTPTTPTTEGNTVQNKTQTALIIEFIGANPGLNAQQLTDILPKRHSEIKPDNISSMLKQQLDMHTLKRTDTGEKGRGGKPLYTYYVTTPQERQEGLEADRRRREAVARAAKAREAKAQRKAEREAQKRKEELKAQRKLRTELIPMPTMPEPRPEGLTEAYKHVKTAWSAKDMLNGLTVLQARELYDELKNLFGG